MMNDPQALIAETRRFYETHLRVKQRRIDRLESRLQITREQLRNTEAARERLHRRVLELEGVEPLPQTQETDDAGRTD